MTVFGSHKVRTLPQPIRFLLFPLRFLVDHALESLGDAWWFQPPRAEAADVCLSSFDGRFIGAEDAEDGAGGWGGMSASVLLVGAGVGYGWVCGGGGGWV